MRRVHAATSALAVALASGAGPAAAVDLTTKTPNIESPRTIPVGELHFPFTHRFGLAGSKVVNSPTLSLSTGLGPSTSAGLRWASNSALAPKDPGNRFHQAIDPVNEFELGLKQGLARQSDAWPVDLTGVLAYNTAANSGDAALVLAHAIGPLTLLANAKGFTSGYGVGGLTVAGGGGIQWRLTRHLNLSADLGGVLWSDRDPLIFATSNTPAVALGVGFQIPYSPHTVLLYVTNAATLSLQGASRGSPPADPKAPVATRILDRLKFGFEFNVPFTNFERWRHIISPPPEAPAVPPESLAPASWLAASQGDSSRPGSRSGAL